MKKCQKIQVIKMKKWKSECAFCGKQYKEEEFIFDEKGGSNNQSTIKEIGTIKYKEEQQK